MFGFGGGAAGATGDTGPAGASDTAHILLSSSITGFAAGTTAQAIFADLAARADKDEQVSNEVQLSAAIGDDFTTANTVQDVLQELVDPSSVSNLQLSGGGGLVVVETGYIELAFNWNENGSPTDLILDDGDEDVNVDVPVSGGFVSLHNNSFTSLTPKKITWTLRGSNVNSISTYVEWAYPRYVSKSSTVATPTGADIAFTPSNTPIRTTGSVTSTVTTTGAEYGWIAVPEDGRIPYTTWYIDALNNSSIGSDGSGEFIEDRGTVEVDVLGYGDLVTYRVYMYGFASDMQKTITLS